MPVQPEIALVVSTYHNPEHLRRCLLSIALQRGVTMEVAVADDGSTDHTPKVVEDFSRTVRFPVRFTTHRHTTHHVARCRNEGVAVTTAPYVLFVDGDCVLPPDHVRIHLQHRRPGFAAGAGCCRWDQDTTTRCTEETIRRGTYLQWVPRDERKRLGRAARRAWLYTHLRHPSKPRLTGNNIAVWRNDLECVNGFDEKFQGWGCEDDDLRLRLRQAGVRVKSIIAHTFTFHLWHPTDPTAPPSGRWRDGANVAFMKRPFRLTRCLDGLERRPLHDLRLRLVGTPMDPDAASGLLPQGVLATKRERDAEFEVLLLPGTGGFSGRAQCNVLVVLQPSSNATRMARKAHVVVADETLPGLDPNRHFKIREFERALRAAA